jgi:multidrug resistance efflux pump
MAIKFKRVSGEHLGINYGKESRTPPRLRWYLLVSLISLPLLFLIVKLIQEYLFINFEGLVVFDTFTIRAPSSGYIETLSVKIGQPVSPGNVLLRIKSPSLEVKLEFLQREKQIFQKMIIEMNLQNYSSFENMLKVASEDMKASKIVYDRFKEYSKKGNMAELQLEEARKTYVTAQRILSQLERDIIETKIKNRTILEVSYKRKLREIDNEIMQLLEDKKYFLMRAQKKGTVMNINTYDNEFVSSSQQLLTIVTKENLRVMAFIEPKYLDRIYIGRKVSIKFPYGETILGKIINTPTYAEKIPISEVNPLATRHNMPIAIIVPLTVIPERYQVFGIPTKISLK